MGLIKDVLENTNGYKFRYRILPFLSPRSWYKAIKNRRQRMNRGWSERDTWAGGEHIMQVAAGILLFLDREHNPIDWDHYFENNFKDNLGYSSLSEVAQDLDNYLYFQEEQYGELDEVLDSDTSFAIELQLYENARNAMQFVATNIGSLWW